MSSEVGSLPLKVELLNLSRAIGEGEKNRILIMDFHVFHVESKGGQFTVDDPLIGLAEWTAQVDRASDGRMSRKSAVEIGAPERVEIELVQLKGEVRGIAIPQLDVATEE